MSKDIRFIRDTLARTYLSSHKFPMAAIIVRGGKILSSGVNCIRTHPRMNRYIDPRADQFSSYCCHAELRAVLNAKSSIEGSTIYVVRRLKKMGRMGIASPCQQCKRLIIEAGIKRVVYSTGNLFKEIDSYKIR